MELISISLVTSYSNRFLKLELNSLSCIKHQFDNLVDLKVANFISIICKITVLHLFAENTTCVNIDTDFDFTMLNKRLYSKRDI